MIELIVVMGLATQPTLSGATTICHEYENRIEADHQWSEDDFTYEKAKAAAIRILEIVEGEYRPDWYELANLHTLIEGFHLKRRALESVEAQESSTYAVSAFCTFLTSRPIVD